MFLNSLLASCRAATKEETKGEIEFVFEATGEVLRFIEVSTGDRN